MKKDSLDTKVTDGRKHFIRRTVNVAAVLTVLVLSLLLASCGRKAPDPGAEKTVDHAISDITAEPAPSPGQPSETDGPGATEPQGDEETAPPSEKPTEEQTGKPSDAPTEKPADTPAPSDAPTPTSTPEPTSTPSPKPTEKPTQNPTQKPTATPAPTEKPTPTPVKNPTVTLSKKGGFYPDTFELEISAPEGFKIYYTTDGTSPALNGKEYENPLTISECQSRTIGKITRSTHNALGYPLPTARMPRGRVIRAYAVDANGNKTPEVTETYLVWKDGADLFDAPIVSLFVEEGDFDGKTGIYYTTMQSPFTTKRRVSAFCEIYDEKGTKQSAQWVEISLSGNGSLGNLQKSIRLYYKSDANPDVTDNPGKLKYDIFRGEARDVNGKKITSFKRLVMRNAGNDAVGSFMADRVSQKIASLLNVDYQEARSVIVLINGELWGTYNMRERYGAKYFEAHYGVLEENFAMLEAPTPLITGNSYSPYELTDGTEKDKKDWEDLVAFIRGNNMKTASNYEKVTAKLDVDSMIDCLIAHMYVCNGDFPWNNVKVWRCSSEKDPSRLDTKWRFVIMDMDGGFISDYNGDYFNHALNNNTILGAMAVSLLKNDTFNQKFIERCIYAAEVVFEKDRCLEIINATAAELEKPIQANFLRWGIAGANEATWKERVNYMRAFAKRRGSVWLSQLYAFFNITPTAITASYDPSAATVKLNGAAADSGSKITLGLSGTETTVSYEVSARSGYDIDAVAVTDSNGKQTILTSNSGSLTLSSDAVLTVMTVKKGTVKGTQAAVAAGSSEVFVLLEGGNLYAWGNNTTGAMGLPARVYTRPQLVMTGAKLVATAQGGSTGDAPFTYVLTSDGRLLTAGANNYGQLGRTGPENVFMQAEIPGNKTVTAFSLGFDHALLLTNDGSLYGIGNNSYCQLGNLGKDRATTWVKLADNVVSAAAGRRHTLYVTIDGTLYALGDNRWGKLNSSAPEMIRSPYPLADNAAKAFAGEHSAFYIDSNSVLYYMGTRAADMMSGGVVGKMNKLMENVKSVSMQEGTALIITNDGKLYGWGENAYNQIATGLAVTQLVPVLKAETCTAAGAGVGYTAYLPGDGTAVISGNNSYGIAGKGATSDKVARSVIALQ